MEYGEGCMSRGDKPCRGTVRHTKSHAHQKPFSLVHRGGADHLTAVPYRSGELSRGAYCRAIRQGQDEIKE
jgi:hypothetical protein